MHFRAAFLFVQKIRQFFALTTRKLLNLVPTQRCNSKKYKPSAVELKKIINYSKMFSTS